MDIEDRDLGLLGERAFQTLCHAVKLTVHKSEMDRTGWDFLVEFPWKKDDRSPVDLLPTPLECKIQVKSTDKQRKRESITLSNLSRLVKVQMPTFFCFIEFDKKDVPQSIYLVHVGREIIEKTLKRIRELENEGNENHLNKHTIDVTYGDVDRLENTSGACLKSRIESFIPEGMEKYIENKSKLLATLGFEDGKYQVTITINSDDPIKDLLDVSLGIRKEINIFHSTGYHKRFGILSKNPDMDCKGGIISLQAKPIQSKLKFKEHKFSPAISFSAKLYNSPFNEFIPEERIKLRVESKFFELIIELGQRVTLSVLPHVENSSLKDLRNFVKILTILESSASPLIVELEVEEKPSFPVVSFTSNDLPSSWSEIVVIDGQNEQVFSWSEINHLVDMVLEICKFLYILEDDVIIEIEDIINLARSGSISLLYQAIYGDTESVIFNFSSISEIERASEGAKAAGVFFVKAQFGNYVIGCCLGVVGSLSLAGKQPSLIGERFLIGRQFIGTGDSIIDKAVVDESLNELIRELENEDLVSVGIYSYSKIDLTVG